MRNTIIATAGHVDHGKTTLIRALTGIETDRWKEEKIRGITIDLGYADLKEGDTTIHFIDVPGHERFVRNMLAGAGTIKTVLMVIAADEGIKPQTLEHFDICRLLGFENGIIAITKYDASDKIPQEVLYEKIRKMTTGTFLENSLIIHVDSISGKGIDKLRAALFETANKISILDTGETIRLPVDRVFTIKGFGTVVTGSLISGEITTGDSLEALPSGRKYTARTLQVFSKQREKAMRGQRVALNLKKAEKADLHRGTVLTNPGMFASTRSFEASVEFLEDSEKVIDKGGKVKLYHLSRETRASITIIGSKKVKKGQNCWARLRFESPIFAFPGDGFIIRSETPVKTIGGGVIVTNKAAKRTPDELETLYRFLLSDPIKTLKVYISESRYIGRDPKELRQLTGFEIGKIIETLNSLKEQREMFESAEGNRFINIGNMSALKQKILKVTDQYHINNPEKPGIHIKELSDQLGEKTDSNILEYALQSLVSEKMLILRRNNYSLNEFSNRFSGEEAHTGEKIEKYYIDTFLTPLARKNVWKEIDEPEAMTHSTIKALLADSTLIKVNDDYLIHEESFNKLRKGLDEMRSKSDEMSISDFKEKFDLSRKFAIPLLEFLDYEGVTRKKQDGNRMIL